MKTKSNMELFLWLQLQAIRPFIGTFSMRQILLRQVGYTLVQTYSNAKTQHCEVGCLPHQIVAWPAIANIASDYYIHSMIKINFTIEYNLKEVKPCGRSQLASCRDSQPNHFVFIFLATFNEFLFILQTSSHENGCAFKLKRGQFPNGVNEWAKLLFVEWLIQRRFELCDI